MLNYDIQLSYVCLHNIKSYIDYKSDVEYTKGIYINLIHLIYKNININKIKIIANGNNL